MYAVEMKDIHKTYPGVVANDGIDLKIEKKSILCLVGENGAGKSTLMNILYGLEQPDSGVILIDGKEVRLSSSADAIKHKIGMVHQHFMLAPELTVLENIILGREPLKKTGIDWNKANHEVSHLCQRFGFELPLDRSAGSLPVGLQQKVEILKILYRGADILILDEPTAVLTPQETGELFSNLRSLASSGKTIILITHKLDEVMQVANNIVVMRKGRLVKAMLASETNAQEIAFHMVGKELPDVQGRKSLRGELVLKVERITVGNDLGVPAVKDLNLDIYAGEIVGIAGVSGNGQRELANAIAGLANVESGSIKLSQIDITSLSRSQRYQLGLSYIPEDRKNVGLCLPWSIAENIVAGNHKNPPYAKGFLKWMDRKKINSMAVEMIKRFDIRTPDYKTAVGMLSGGNQQKVVVAREMSRLPKVIIASEPTRGVDVGAINFIHNQLMELRNHGAAIIAFSSDLDEIFQLSDRIAVLFSGEIVALLDPTKTTREELGVYMAGIKRQEGK